MDEWINGWMDGLHTLFSDQFTQFLSVVGNVLVLHSRWSLILVQFARTKLLKNQTGVALIHGVVQCVGA